MQRSKEGNNNVVAVTFFFFLQQKKQKENLETNFWRIYKMQLY